MFNSFDDVRIKILDADLTETDLIYSGTVNGVYFEDCLNESMAIFDEINRKLNTADFHCMHSIINELLYADYMRYLS